ncbi:MAG: hypothetical protein IPJ58_07815 [Ardenticatenia bacterium]|nr:hypothetical protein [Ardenticatenia bacterium]
MIDAPPLLTPAPSWGWTELTLAVLGAAVAGTGWSALVLAQAGRFSAVLALTGGVVGGLAALAFALRRPRAEDVADSGGGSRSVQAPITAVVSVATLRGDRWGAAALALAIAITAWQRPAGAAWPAALDSGWYLGSAAWIVRSGGLDFRSAALAELPRGPLRRQFVSSFDDQRAVLDPAGGRFPAGADLGLHAVSLAVPAADEARLRPYHPPFLAALLAVALELAGPERVADVALVAGLLWLLAVAALARRVAGGAAGLAAVALAGSGPSFAYYAGQPFAELAAGAALMAGLWLLVAGRPAALAAGLCLGLAALIKVDALPAVVAALGGGLWALRGQKRAPARLLAGAALGLGHLLLLLATVNQVYLRLNGGGVLKLARRAGPTMGAILLAAAVLAVAWRHRPARWSAWRLPYVLGAVALSLLLWGQIAAWLAPEGAAPSMLAIAAWLLTPLGLWLGVSGAVDLLTERWLTERRTDLAPVIAVIALAIPFVLLAPLVSRGLSPLYAGRRLLVVALPLTAVLAAAALAPPWNPAEAGARSPRFRLFDAGALWRSRLLSAAALALVLWTQSAAATPFRGARGRDLSGGLSLIRRLAAATPPDAVIVFPSVLDGSHVGRLAAALEALEGRSTVVVGRPELDAAALAQAVAVWQGAGRPVFLALDDGREPPELPGQALDLVHEDSIVTRHLAPRPAMPPTMASLPLGIDLYVVNPDAP